MKKYIRLIVVFIFAAGVLVACGGGNGNSGGAPPAPSGTSTGVWDQSKWDDGSTWAP